MSEKSGFFNALQSGGVYDRIYDASDFASYFSSFIGNGVFVSPVDQLKVVAKSGRTVTVKKGKAFIDGYYYELTEDKDITLSVNNTSQTVTDLIVRGFHKDALRFERGPIKGARTAWETFMHPKPDYRPRSFYRTS